MTVSEGPFASVPPDHPTPTPGIIFAVGQWNSLLNLSDPNPPAFPKLTRIACSQESVNGYAPSFSPTYIASPNPNCLKLLLHFAASAVAFARASDGNNKLARI